LKVMSEIKPYKDQEPESQSVSEVVMMYEASTSTVDDFIASLPKDMMQKLIDFAVEECNAGRCISHEQVKVTMKERMGWK
jgi:hypothetical protein